MKRVLLLLISIFGFNLVVNGQSELDFSPFHSQAKDDSELTIRYQNMDEVYNYGLYGRSNQYDNIERGVRQAVERSQSGINVSYDNSTVRTGGKSRRQAAAQAQKAQNEANHQAWRAQQDAVKEAERLRREQERLRKEMEYQRRYNEAVKRGYQQTESKYARLHANTDYKANEGFDKMLNTRPKGTERIQSGHITAQPISTSDIVSVIQRRPRHNNTIVITGTETSSLGRDWHSDELAFNELLATEMMRESSERHRNEWSEQENPWHELKKNMDGGQLAAMDFLIKENNNGTFPKLVGITDSGRFVFESEDGNRLFSISDNGRHLQIATLDENHWYDDNIIKAIQDDGGIWNAWVQTVQDKTIKYKGGTIRLIDLNKLGTDELKQLLPQIKMELKLNAFDNSSTIQYKYYYLMPAAVNTKAIGVPIATNVIVGGRAKLSAGEKIGARMEFNMTPVLDRDTNTSIFGAMAEAKTADAEVSATVGTVVRVGSKYYLTSGEVSGNAGLGAKAEAKLDIKHRTGKYGIKMLYGASIGGAFFQDITPATSEPTQ